MVTRIYYYLLAAVLVYCFIVILSSQRQYDLAFKELEHWNNVNTELINTLRSNSQHLRKLCDQVQPTAPEGWYPFDEWYKERRGI